MNKLVMFTLNSVPSSLELTRRGCLTRPEIIYEKSTKPSMSQPGAHELKLFFKQYGFNNYHYSAVMQFANRISLYQDLGRVSVYRVSEFNGNCVSLKLSMPTNKSI